MSDGPDGLTIRGATEADREELLAFLSTQMGAEREYFDAAFRYRPGALWEHSRVGVVDGRIACHIRLYPREMRLAGGTVRTANIGDVCTDPAHRHKGFGGALLRDGLAYMAAHGIPMSIIHSGVTGFYASGGWETFPQRGYSFAPRRPLLRVPGIEVRRMRRHADLDAVARVHGAHSAGRSLAVVRDESYWRTHFSWVGDDEREFLVAEDDGGVVGYVRSYRGAVHEIAYLPERPRAADALLEAVVRRRSKRAEGRVEIALDAPTDLPSLAGLRDAGVLVEKVRWHMLVRSVSLKALLEAVAPGLHPPRDERRVALRSGNEAAAVVFDGDEARVDPDDGADAVEVTQRDLFLWLTGEAPLGASGGAAGAWALLREMVRSGAPHFWMIDHV